MGVKSSRANVGRVLAALICVALAAGPVAAFAADAEPAHSSASTAMSHDSPCDMPCDGCEEGESLGCILACNGLVANIPMIDPEKVQEILGQRIVCAGKAMLAGREREPDTPPPKFDLA